MANKQVAEKKDSEVAVYDTDLLSEGTGLEEASSNDFAIPFLRVIQAMSPQLKKSDGKYIDGAGQGMLFNTVTNEVYDGDEGVLIIPCVYSKQWIEWVPRTQGGGFVSSDHDASILEKCSRNEKKEYILDNGNEIKETAQYFSLIVNDEAEPEQVLLSFASSQLGFSRRWNSMLRTARVKNAEGTSVLAPIFSYIYRVRTVEQSNDLGSWYGVTAEREKPTPIELARLSLDFMKAAKGGSIVVKQESGSDAADDSEEIPF